jgi:aspartate aminotransferase
MFIEKMTDLAQTTRHPRHVEEETGWPRGTAVKCLRFQPRQPELPAPPAVKKALSKFERRGFRLLPRYKSNAGYEPVRAAVAESLNKRFGTASARKTSSSPSERPRA